ncbi:hypothetical protein SDC9_147282 [bioreactor metagenome]|uniref:Uncharacterized protein n=1 Tax=bioreactor metagenome TaxID=1076179 RepID=A0A645EDK8_9ZZZZ
MNTPYLYSFGSKRFPPGSHRRFVPLILLGKALVQMDRTLFVASLHITLGEETVVLVFRVIAGEGKIAQPVLP